MRTTLMTLLLAGTFAVPALLASTVAMPAQAQVVAPPSPEAGAATNAAVAHHDRAVARRAARHGNYRKAAHASSAANAAAANAAVAPQ